MDLTKKVTLLSLALLGLFAWGCNKFQLDALKERYNDNLFGSLTNPSNITIADPNNFSFVVIGDTHIGSPGGEVMKRIAGQSVTDGDSFVIVAGDLTDNGDIGQFRQFQAVMAEQLATYRVAIGNHDIFFDGWENYKKTLGKSIYSFDAGPIHFAMIDSANGVLGRDQLIWLDNDLRQTSKTIKMVVSHFPPWNGYFSSMFKMSSDEETAILKDLFYRHQVQVMFAGHYHGYAENTIGTTQYIVTGGANNINDPGQKKHFVRTRYNAGTITIEKIDLD